MIIIYVILFLLIVLAGYAAGHFEVERLTVSTEPEDRRWTKEVLAKRFKMWKTDQTHWFKKLTDSYHLFHTIEKYALWLFTITLCIRTILFGGEIISIILQVLIATELYWWIRNIEMLIVALKQPRWWYLVPRLGGILENKLGKK